MFGGFVGFDHVVVVGASLAGLRACQTLRNDGFEGTVTLLGAESHRPYDRPPLSKKVLAGEWELDRVFLSPEDEFAGLRLDLRLGCEATGLDTARREVTTTDGSLNYDGLIIATGATPRRLPFQPRCEGVTELRTLQDAENLRRFLTGGDKTVVIIGAGFIGLEVAATARGLGCDVTVLEAAPAPLMRGLGAEMGEAVAMVHTRNGVKLRCGVAVEEISEKIADTGRVCPTVRLSSGESLAADVVVVGVGVTPATQWLEGSDLDLRDGVNCDRTLNVGVPGVYAAGDCVRWHNPWLDPHDDAVMRAEHWTNAVEQGVAAAHNLLTVAGGGEAQPFSSVPFVWSDQFDSRIQLVGRPHGDDEVRVVSSDGDRFVAMYGYGGRLRAALSVGMARVLMPFRKLLAEQASLDDALAHADSLAG